MKKELIKQSLIGFCLGGGLFYLIFQFLSKDIIAKVFEYDSFLIVFPSIVLAIFAALLIHELGHLLCGIVQGFKTELFVVGFLGIHRKEGKLAVYFNKDFQFFGGIAAVLPDKKMEDLRRKYAVVIAGGPLFSVLFGFVLLGVFSYQNSVFNTFLATSGVLSFLIFFATVVPSKSGSFFTDRKRFQRLLSKGREGRAELALLETIHQNFIDGDCRRVQIEKLDVLKEDPEPFVQFWGYYFEYHHLKDNEKPISEGLMEQLKGYEPHFPKAVWKTFKLDES